MSEVVGLLARDLRREGFATAVITGQGRAAARASERAMDALRAQGVTVHALDELEGGGWLDEWQPHVVSAHSPPRWILEYAKARSIPIVETLHLMPSLVGIDWAIEPERSSLVAHFVAVSELVRQAYLTGNRTFAQDRIHVVPNGIDPEGRRRYHRSDARRYLGLTDDFLVLSLGRFAIQKNTYALVDAFSEVAERVPDAHLLVAGDPADPRYCRRILALRETAPCKERIHLRAHFAEPGILLSAADAFVLNSFAEGWPLASMEAVAFGLPVVMTEVSGAVEQLGSRGHRGTIVPNPLGDPLAATWEAIHPLVYRRQGNRQELIDALVTLAENRDYWGSTRDARSQEASGLFTSASCVSGHAAVLMRALGG